MSAEFVDTLVWLVESVVDRGERYVYRWSVRGRILEPGRRDEQFSWQVPSLGNPRYVAAPGVELDRRPPNPSAILL